jgi:hypothetical protein
VTAEIPSSILPLAKVLVEIPNAPVVFLIDEYHGDERSTKENISHATALVKHARVTLIGVESHSGGFEWDQFTEDYVYDCDNDPPFDTGEDETPVNTWPMFAEATRLLSAKIVGVESWGMFAKQDSECKTVEEVRAHPLNAQRSEHFIKTLFELHARNGSVGNLILNAGSEHHNHIANWIADGSIKAKAGQKASYVRIRAGSYPESSEP